MQDEITVSLSSCFHQIPLSAGIATRFHCQQELPPDSTVSRTTFHCQQELPPDSTVSRTTFHCQQELPPDSTVSRNATALYEAITLMLNAQETAADR